MGNPVEMNVFQASCQYNSEKIKYFLCFFQYYCIGSNNMLSLSIYSKKIRSFVILGTTSRYSFHFSRSFGDIFSTPLYSTACRAQMHSIERTRLVFWIIEAACLAAIVPILT